MLRSIQGRALPAAILASTMALAGCGSSGSGSTSTATQASATTTQSTTTSASAPASTSKSTPAGTTSTATQAASAPEKVPIVDVGLKTSVARQPIQALYTCDGSNTPPPFSWSKIPRHTVELDLFVLNLEDANNKIFVDWGVAGLKPSLHALKGKLPAGAVVARNSFGQSAYSICPPKGSKETYVVLLDALTKRVPVKPGFDAASLVEHLLHTEVHEGQLTFSYQRG